MAKSTTCARLLKAQRGAGTLPLLRNSGLLGHRGIAVGRRVNEDIIAMWECPAPQWLSWLMSEKVARRKF